MAWYAARSLEARRVGGAAPQRSVVRSDIGRGLCTAAARFDRTTAPLRVPQNTRHAFAADKL
jgi:hypothetical protein